MKDYLSMAHQPSERKQVCSSLVPNARYYAVFEVPQVILDFLKEKHPLSEVLSNLSVAYAQGTDGESLLKITIYKKHIVITAANQEGLKFHNCFFCDGEQDMLYYILGSVKNLSFEPDKIILDGIVNKHETIYHRLRQYFSHVGIASNPTNIHFSYLLEKLPDARFINLFNSLA
jgi:hypothetical protein